MKRILIIIGAMFWVACETGPAIVEQPDESDDPFFLKPAEPEEAFRVLITEEAYEVRQVGYNDRLSRQADESGDMVQHSMFLEHDQKLNFHEWELSATIEIRINPHRGSIERIQFVPGKTPRTWQAGVLFQEDVSRFRFQFPRGNVDLREFHVTYLWRINREEGISDELSRERALEFLRQEGDR